MNEREALREEWEKLCGAAKLLDVAAKVAVCVPWGNHATFGAHAGEAVDLAQALIEEARRRSQVPSCHSTTFSNKTASSPSVEGDERRR